MSKKNIISKASILAVGLLIICSSQSFAQNAQDIINQQDWITRQQQNTLEFNKRNAEFDAIKKERQRRKKEEGEKKLNPEVSGKTKVCILLKEIHLLDAKHISNYSQKKLVKPFIGRCMDAETLAAIIKEVNGYYHDKGYITTQVVVPQQNLQSGIFELRVVEGGLEKISLGKDRLIEDMQKFTAFGGIEGEILDIEDINQGIYQINRLQSNQAVMKVEPGSSVGDSLIRIDNDKKFPAKITIGKDNLGNKFTGVQRVNFSSNFDNLLFLNDNINLNYSTNIHDDSSIKDIKSFSATASVPFKYNTLTYDFSHSNFKGQNAGNSGNSTLTGFSQSAKVTIDRVFLSKAKLRFSGNVSVVNKSSASYLNGEKIITSERQLSILNVGLTSSIYLDNSTSIYLSPSYSRGLKILNAKKDQPDYLNTAPKAQFDAFKLYANFSKRLTVPKLELPLNFATEMSGQYSKQTLFGSEQFSVGGYYSVRGFRENYINGDSGYYLRNKINLNLGSIAAPFAKNSSGFFGKNLVHLNKFSIEPFYDYGYVKNNFVDNGASGRLSGAGLKTLFNSKYFNASLTYSWGIGRSQLITSSAKENKMVYFELSGSI